MIGPWHRPSPDGRGQALVEFSLAVTIFLVLIMAIVDLGRGIYQFNGVSEAAREIARVTSVHPGSTLGTSAETAAVVQTQRQLIPSLGIPTFTCVDIAGAAVAGTCRPGDVVRVQISAPWSAVTPLLGLAGTWTLSSHSSMQIEPQS